MTSETLRQYDAVLSRCGRPLAPPGFRVVAIPKRFKCWATFQATPRSLIQTIQTTITGDTTWMFRAISSYAPFPVNLSIQIQFPDGKFLFHDSANMQAIAGFGSWRFALTKERPCPPGTKIIATFNNADPANAQNVPLLLEGSYFYHVRGGSASLPESELASYQPRYVPGQNQNILAPCWQLGYGPRTPDGFVDSPEYTYASQVVSIDVGAATPKDAVALVQLEAGSDFVCRTLWFKVVPESGREASPSGLVMAKIRSSSGYAFTDDYILTTILNGLPWAKDWVLAARETIICDLQLVDFSGDGTVSVQVFAKGVKRRRA